MEIALQGDLGSSRPMTQRQAGLDLLRALAIIWVMIYHASIFELISGEWTVVGFGWMGVDLFFVLSGFLVAGQLLKPVAANRSPEIRRFLFRRLFRTLPAYLAVLGIYFACPGWRERTVIQPLWQFVSFTQNLFIRLDTPKAFSHAWSLCVEEQFYLILPFLVIMSRQASRRGVTVLLVVLCVTGMILRGGLWLSFVGQPAGDIGAIPDPRAFMEWVYYPTWSRLDGLLAGVAVALIQHFHPVWWTSMEKKAGWMALLGLLGIGASFLLFRDQIAPFWATVLGYPFLAVSMALLVASAAFPRSPLGRAPVPGARVIATGAYSLYLSHKMVFHAVKGAGWSHALTAPLVLVAAFCLALMAGAVLFFCVERPFLLLRDRIDGRTLTVNRAVTQS